MSSQDPEQRKLADVLPESHQRSGLIECCQFWAPLVVFPALVAWRLLDSWWQVVPGPTWHAPGNVAHVHAPWEANCAACHTPFTPTSATNWLAMTSGTTHAADAQCQGCHAGADHHHAEHPQHRAGCTACHREHRGRETSLLRVADGQCTRCHSVLNAILAQGAHTHFGNVSRFDAEHHPEFRILRDKRPDPGRLKFNHKLHMTQGMVLTRGGASFALKDVDSRYRENYRHSKDQPDDSPVQLACSSCHQLDSRDLKLSANQLVDLPKSAVLPARAGGKTMLPIVYEKHCQACHPLTFDRKRRDDPRSGLVAVRHRLQPTEIRTFLQAHFIAQGLENPLVPAPPPQPPLPGRSPEPDEQTALLETVAEQVARAEQELYLGKKTCGECHDWQPPDAQSVRPDRLAELRVEPTEVREVWFEHALFNHASHRLLECRTCHAHAYADDDQASTARQDVLLPGIRTCIECHSPHCSGGGAKHDCVECHRYHDGDHPLAGKGSAARAGPNAGTRTIRQFLDDGSP